MNYQEGCYRNELYPGLVVDVVKKEHQKTGELTRGKIVEILTSKSFHSRGIKAKVIDDSGIIHVGRTKKTFPSFD